MNAQLLITILLIALASAYLFHRGWKSWRSAKSGGCAGGCGCAKSTQLAKTEGPSLIPSSQLTLRQRPTEPSS